MVGGGGEGARLVGDVRFLKEQEEGQVIVHAATKGGTLGSKVTLRSKFQKTHNPPGRAEVSVPGGLSRRSRNAGHTLLEGPLSVGSR